MRYFVCWTTLLAIGLLGLLNSLSNAASYPDDGDQYIEFKIAGGCLTVQEDSWGEINESAKLLLQRCHGSNSQIFITERDLNGNLVFHPSGRTDLCVEVVGARREAGIEVSASSCDGNPNQSFQWSAHRSGASNSNFVQIAAVHSGLCLDVSVEKQSHALIQNVCSPTSAAQSFQVVRLSMDPSLPKDSEVSSGGAAVSASAPAILLPPSHFSCELVNEYGIFHNLHGTQPTKAQALASALQDCADQGVPSYVCNRSGRTFKSSY